jgi:parallel beta-helix repeat protein
MTSLALAIATLIGLPPGPPDPAPSVSAGAAPHSRAAPTNPSMPGFDPRQAALVAAEDTRVFALARGNRPGTPPHTQPVNGGLPTLILPGRPTPYDMDALVAGGAVVRQPDGGLLLVHSVLVDAGAQLSLNTPNSTLRMASGPGGNASLVSVKGSMNIGGGASAPMTVTSWDPAKNAPDTDPTDGRAYIRAIGSRMDLHDLNASDLGFWSGRTGGIAWTGSATQPATGSARQVNVSGNQYGIFAARTEGLLINGAQLKGSAMDGVAVHRGADGTQLWRVSSLANARNGIAVTQGAHNTSLNEVTTTSNARNGIYLDGTPLANGPNPSGAATTRSAGFTVDGSSAQANSEHGILVDNADKVTLSNNMISSNRDGIVVRGTTQGVALEQNHISSPGGFAVAVRDGSKDAVVDKNVISDALTAVQVDNAVAKVTGNEVDGMTVHGVSVIGAGSGSSITDNRLAGRGPSSIDVNRLSFGGVVDISGNDESNWVVDRDDARYLASFVSKHPLVLLWFLTLVFPFAARLVYKRRHKLRNLGKHPYQSISTWAASSPAGYSAAGSSPAVPVGFAGSAGLAAGSRPPARSGTPARQPAPPVRANPAPQRPVANPRRTPTPGQPMPPRHPAQTPPRNPAAPQHPLVHPAVAPHPPAPRPPARLPGRPASAPPPLPGPSKRSVDGPPAQPSGGPPRQSPAGRSSSPWAPRPASPPVPRATSAPQPGPPAPPPAPGTSPSMPSPNGPAGANPPNNQPPGNQPPSQGQQHHGQDRRPPKGGTRITVVSPQ